MGEVKSMVSPGSAPVIVPIGRSPSSHVNGFSVSVAPSEPGGGLSVVAVVGADVVADVDVLPLRLPAMSTLTN